MIVDSEINLNAPVMEVRRLGVLAYLPAKARLALYNLPAREFKTQIKALEKRVAYLKKGAK